MKIEILYITRQNKYILVVPVRNWEKKGCYYVVCIIM